MPRPDFERLTDATPHARFLSNGRFTTLVTSAGTGGSWWQGSALTPFVPDRLEDPDGLHLFVRDLAAGAFTSLGFQPSGGDTAEIAARSTPGRVVLERRALGLAARLELCVLPEHDVELRRITLRDTSGRARQIELTSCAGVVLFPAAAHASHPAFSKLFVETACAGERLLARRRPRSQGERWPWLAAGLAGPGAFTCETDRARFLGRGRSAARPLALSGPGPLSGTLGSVLDPVFALRRTLALEPGGEAVFVHALAAGEEREAALAALEHALAGDAGTLLAAAERAEIERRCALGLEGDDAEQLQELAGAVLYGHPGLLDERLARARGSLAVLERFGVRRDLPYLLAERESEALLRARAYWSALGAPLSVVSAPSDAEGTDLLRAAAACVIGERWPELHPSPRLSPVAPRFRPARPSDCAAASVQPELPPADPRLPESGVGYFADGGSEYVLEIDGARPPEETRPPMPWANVIANERFGVLVSESGAANSWARNSRENRLTPWSNDPIADPHGEAFYLRDEEAGVFWSPQPGPTPGPAPYVVRHGLGYSTWCHEAFALASELHLFVPKDAPLRVAWLVLENRSREARTLSVFSYQRLVLGGDERAEARFVVTDFDAAAQALFATRRVGEERADEVVFAAAVAAQPAEGFASGDRETFLGRGGSPEAPAALLHDAALDGRTGAGLEPCAALQLRLRLAPGERRSCAFLLGEAASPADARDWIERYRQPGAVEDAFAATQRFWRELAGAVRIETPASALDVLVNAWLPYQVLACRIWGRTAFYQSGGAYGFRDQLQDATSLVLHAPALARRQIVLHAGRQFPEGDVQHWWHPPSGRGTRTRCSDDRLWLPHLTAHYVRTTGDASLLDEPAGFVGARTLEAGEDEAFLTVEELAEQDDVYGHCCRALDRSLAVGAHGLPLIGTCDWNDGMSRVGREGRGESVWLGFFLFQTLGDFAPLCRTRGDDACAERYLAHRAQLATALEAAWDGDWYRRAYYDDGTPLGSAAAEECRIDVLPQAWAAITGAVSNSRSERALDAMERELVREADGMIRLLWPPFDRTPQDPGYIRGYLPGIRENGGQYTHAALWAVRGLAAAGRRERAARLLELLTPVHHTRSAAATAIYQVEPYLVAADLYGVAPHVGRGGWTGYTGSAGWMLRVALESVLGITLEGGDTLCVRPCIPDAWPGFRVALRLADGRTQVEVEVRNANGRAADVVSCRLDGAAAPVEGGAARVRVPRDGARHRLEVELG